MWNIINKFEKRGYNKRELIQIGVEVGKMDKNELRHKKKKDKPNTPLYISTYDTHAVLVKRAIKKTWHVLQNDRTIGRLFRDNPKFIYKKGKTIANYLTRADIKKKKGE